MSVRNCNYWFGKFSSMIVEQNHLSSRRWRSLPKRIARTSNSSSQNFLVGKQRLFIWSNPWRLLSQARWLRFFPEDSLVHPTTREQTKKKIGDWLFLALSTCTCGDDASQKRHTIVEWWRTNTSLAYLSDFFSGKAWSRCVDRDWNKSWIGMPLFWKITFLKS